MRNLIIVLFFLPFIANSQIWYVATDGDDSNPGTLAQPFLTWQVGFDSTEAGDTLYIRGGTYMNYKGLTIDTSEATKYGHSGTPTKPILIAGYPADVAASNRPILNCILQCDCTGSKFNGGINLTKVQYITLRCFDVKNVFQCDSVLSGGISSISCKNITFERLRVYNIGQRGFWCTSGAWGYADSAYAVDYMGTTPANASPYFAQPDTTRWINCDVWNCCDTLNINPPNAGNGGDGWKVISYNGNYYSWEGCRAWNYSDDGLDPNGGKRVFSNCWVMASDKYSDFHNEGNGFKTSSLTNNAFLYYTYADSVMYRNDSMIKHTNCLAMFCTHMGFLNGASSDYACHSRYYNNTAYRCGTGFYARNYSADSIGDVYYNNLTVYSTRISAGGKAYEIQIDDVKYLESNNTWVWDSTVHLDFIYNPAFTVDSADFRETDSLDLIALFTAARKADGSLPDSLPIMLMSNSDLIDGGKDIGLPFNGAAPDVGYYEYAAGGAPGSPPEAGFTASSNSILTRGYVAYTDTSTNTPTSWAWTFEGGNPSTSNAQNPTVYYFTEGVFDVSLTATNADGFDSEAKTDYIDVTKSYKISIKIK